MWKSKLKTLKFGKPNKKAAEKKPPPKKKQPKHPKIAFQLSVIFFLFCGWLFEISLFWQLGPKSVHTKNTIKIGVSGPFFFWKADVCHETAVFGPKNPKFINFSYHFFLPIFFSFKNKKHKNLLKPLFYSVFANPKKREFSKSKLKTLKFEKPNFCTLFFKKAIFRKLPENWEQKKNTKR